MFVMKTVCQSMRTTVVDMFHCSQPYVADQVLVCYLVW
jgi:hypothetical protein